MMRTLRLAAEASKASVPTPRASNSKLVFGNGDRVYDKGVWKRFKYCQQCQLIIVDRKKWENNWEDVKFCSAKCRAASKRVGKGGELDKN